MAAKKANSAWYEPGLMAPYMTGEKLQTTLLLTVSDDNEWKKTAFRVTTAVPEPAGSNFFPFFMHNIFSRLVPLFSPFFFAILYHYGLQALHIHANSILLLSIFAFYCEAYVGVMPSVALLRHFFFLRIKEGHCSGCINFVAANKTNAISKAGKKAEGFRSKWVMMDAKCVHPR